MPLPWFRFYTEFAHDPKVQTLPIPWRFAFTMILCWHAEGELGKLPDRVKAKIFEMTMEELEEMKETFTDLGFIENGWTPKNWEKRQRASDTSNARVKAFRERKRQGVTLQSPLRNGDVTDLLLISSSKEKTDASIIEEEEIRTSNVTQPLRNGDVTVTDIKQPSYPDPTTSMVMMHTGKHVIDDPTARDLWARIWSTWKDQSLCLGWYEHQRWYSSETWIAAFSQAKKQCGDKEISIRYIEKIAANIDAHGVKDAKPFAADAAAPSRPKTRTEMKHEAWDARLEELKAKLPPGWKAEDDDEEPDPSKWAKR